jgi:hypothetical protein
MGSRLRNWITLDNGSTLSIFLNPDLVEDIRTSSKTLLVCIGNKCQTSHTKQCWRGDCPIRLWESLFRQGRHYCKHLWTVRSEEEVPTVPDYIIYIMIPRRKTFSRSRVTAHSLSQSCVPIPQSRLRVVPAKSEASSSSEDPTTLPAHGQNKSKGWRRQSSIWDLRSAIIEDTSDHSQWHSSNPSPHKIISQTPYL